MWGGRTSQVDRTPRSVAAHQPFPAVSIVLAQGPHWWGQSSRVGPPPRTCVTEAGAFTVEQAAICPHRKEPNQDTDSPPLTTILLLIRLSLC